MPKTTIKSHNKDLMSYQDLINSSHQFGIHNNDPYHCLMIPRISNSHLYDHPGFLIRVQQNLKVINHEF